jgi:acetate kinase
VSDINPFPNLPERIRGPGEMAYNLWRCPCRRSGRAVLLSGQEMSGAFSAGLGGLDTLVFAGGIGENAPTVDVRICDGLGSLGIELEEKRNAANEVVISAAASRFVVRVIRMDEEFKIARSVTRLR